MHPRFADKVALITAGAGGIGRATALIIASEGGTAVAVDMDRAALERLEADCATLPGRAVGVRADGLDPAAVDAVVATIVREHGRIDILVNVLGGGTIIPKMGAHIDELSFDEWQKLLNFNLTGTFLFCHAVAPVMKRQASGKIVNVTSMAGRGITQTSSSAYVTAKGGIIALTRKLALELGPHGINVNAIAPGLTLSERLKPIWESRSAAARDAQLQKIPLRRIGTPEDQARVICFLASDDAAFVTGLTLDVTGGQSGSTL